MTDVRMEGGGLPACDPLSFLNDIGGNYLKVQEGKDYSLVLFDPPKTEKDPFGEKETDTRRTYTVEYESGPDDMLTGKMICYNPGTIWEKEFKAEMIAKKISQLPVRIRFKKSGDGKKTTWSLKVEAL